MIEIALTTLLRTYAGVDKRIQPSTETIRVTEDLPRVVYSLISAPRTYCDDGNAGLVAARYQLDIFAKTATAAHGIADAIRIGIDGFSGVVDSTAIQRIHFEGDHFAQGVTLPGENNTVARYVQDLFVTYRERTH